MTNVSGAPIVTSTRTIHVGSRERDRPPPQLRGSRAGPACGVVGSSGYLELAVREGSAAAASTRDRGDGVQIELEPTVKYEKKQGQTRT